MQVAAAAHWLESEQLLAQAPFTQATPVAQP
jgi:hypothetical protein